MPSGLSVMQSIAALLLMSAAAAQQGKVPPPYTRKSIERGQQVYLRNCIQCHDRDGRALSGRDFTSTPPADLTDPESWLHARTPEGIYASIREGTKEEMPAYKGKLPDEELWHMVNFVRSLWPEAMRPKLEDEGR